MSVDQYGDIKKRELQEKKLQKEERLTEALDARDHPEFYFLFFPLEFVFTTGLGKLF